MFNVAVESLMTAVVGTSTPASAAAIGSNAPAVREKVYGKHRRCPGAPGVPVWPPYVPASVAHATGRPAAYTCSLVCVSDCTEMPGAGTIAEVQLSPA